MQRSKKNDRDHSQESVEKCAQKEFDRADIVRDVRLKRWSQWVDATPSNIKLLFKGGVQPPLFSISIRVRQRSWHVRNLAIKVTHAAEGKRIATGTPSEASLRIQGPREVLQILRVHPNGSSTRAVYIRNEKER
jgi:hypothetical protein